MPRMARADTRFAWRAASGVLVRLHVGELRRMLCEVQAHVVQAPRFRSTMMGRYSYVPVFSFNSIARTSGDE